jgi:hypothetical protein
LKQRLTHALDATGDPDNFAAASQNPGSVTGDDAVLAIGAYTSPSSLGFDGNGQMFLYALSGGAYALAATLNPDDAFDPQLMAIQNSGFGDGLLVVGNQQIGGGPIPPVYVYSAAKVISAQIAFQGVRRQKGALPALTSRCTHNPKPYTYTLAGQLTAAGPALTPLTLTQTVDNYDFEFDQVVITYRSAAALPRVVSKVMLFDAVKGQLFNIPVLDVYVNGAPLSPYEDGAIVPPLIFPQQSQIRVDLYSQVPALNLPVTVEVQIVGRQRVPCGACGQA